VKDVKVLFDVKAHSSLDVKALLGAINAAEPGMRAAQAAGEYFSLEP
jgi:hypothetical protein